MPTDYSTSLFSSNLKFTSENQYGGALSIAGCSAEKLVKEFGFFYANQSLASSPK
jgi:diaminopimelate decarboxylase